MADMTLPTSRNDDPRRLRDLLERARGMASGHSVSSVVVGIAGLEGDLLFPEVVDFIESALRVDDAIFRMTRERAVLVLSDVDRTGAEDIVARLLGGFAEQYAAVEDPAISFGFFEITPQRCEVSVKEVLPALFAFPHPCH